jgi:hypothetical protein
VIRALGAPFYYRMFITLERLDDALAGARSRGGSGRGPRRRADHRVGRVGADHS